MKGKVKLLVLAAMAAGQLWPCSAQNKVTEFGKRIKDAAVETYNDAKDAVGRDGKNQGRAKSGPKLSDAVYYVSASRGSNKNKGTKEAPLKNLQRAVELAGNGATILVAEGNYFGMLNSGDLLVNKPVTIRGGYSTDFSERNVLKYRTVIRPSTESNLTRSGEGTMVIKIRQKEMKLIVDGLLFDRGNTIAYDEEKDGFRSMKLMGMQGAAGEEYKDNTRSVEVPMIFFDNVDCSVEIRNCAFVNAPHYAIKGSAKGRVDMVNNLFVNVRMAAVELGGMVMAQNPELYFTGNTVVFAWSRLKDMADMGYGYRFMNGANGHVSGCVFGCAAAAGLDRTRVDSIREQENQRVTEASDNIFFRNRQADLMIPGGEEALKVRVADFADVKQLAAAEGNRGENDLSLFREKLDGEYLEAFETGKAYAPRYPFLQALKLFGAVKGCGAQIPE